MCHTLHCIQQRLCLSFISFSPPAEPTCCLPLSLCQNTLLHILQWQMIHFPIPTTRPIHAYARPSINALLSSLQGFFCQPFFSSVKVSFALLSCFPSTDTSSFSPEPCISMSLFLSLNLDFFPVSPLQASSAASNWAQISCFCLAPHPLPSLHYRPIYFPSLPIHISVVPGLLFAILIISMLF